MPKSMNDGCTSIAYLLKRFPRLSETFILHEMLALERRGLDLHVYSLLDPEEQLVHADVERLQAPVEYLPSGPGGAFLILWAHLRVLVGAPWRYFGALFGAVARGRRTALKHFARAGWLADRLVRARVGHLHAHFAHGPASIAHFVAMMTGLPFSFTAHAKDIYTSPRELLAAKVRAARFVVTCTDYNASHLSAIALGQSERIHRIYHGIDLFKFRPDGHQAPVAAPEATLLAVGRLVPKKGLEFLVEAVRLVRAEGRKLKLRIVGSGPERALLERRIETAELSGAVELLGPRPHEALPRLYREATACVLPCVVTDDGDRDGIPNVLVEAMRMGVPVISTSISGIPELVRDGETGLLVPPRDAAALAKAIERLLDDADLRRRLIANAAARVTTEFDLDRNAERLHALLQGAA
jgi:glycosyltransferase involved in cell wall biosynthesis